MITPGSLVKLGSDTACWDWSALFNMWSRVDYASKDEVLVLFIAACEQSRPGLFNRGDMALVLSPKRLIWVHSSTLECVQR